MSRVGGPRLSERVVERVVGVEVVVLHEVPGPPVHVVGPALERGVDDAAARAAVLRVVGVGLDLELFDRVHGRREVVAAARAVGRAVEQELVGGQPASVERPGRAALVVERPQPRGAGGAEGRHLPVHASGQPVQHEDHAPVEGHVLHHLAVDDLAQAAAGRVEQRGLGADLDRLAHVAQLEPDVHGGVLSDGQRDARLHVPAEAGHLHLDAVLAGDQEARGVDAVGLGHGLPAHTGALVDDGDGGPGDGGSVGIGDAAEDGAAELLSGGEGGRREEGKDDGGQTSVVPRSDHEMGHAHPLVRPFKCLN